jgi:hypothetical protein
VLEFELLFLRPAGTGEGNIIVTDQDLELYAETVWLAERQDN